MIRELRNWAFVIAGSALVGLGVVCFLQPNQIATGGTPGMAILIQSMSGLSIGMLIILINIPLLLIAYRIIGKTFFLRTVVTTFLCSISVEIFARVFELGVISEDKLLSSLFGGILVGTGVGAILRGNSSAGGSTIIARILYHEFRIRPGQTILMMDAAIIFASAFVFNGIEPSLWSLVCIYATSRCIDVVISGSTSERIVHIVTNHVTAVGDKLNQELGFQGTIVSGVGMNNKKVKNMIFVVVENRRLGRLRELVHSVDRDAFIVVMKASELMGRGH